MEAAIISALLNEFILLAKKAHTHHEDCRNLVATLESQLVTGVGVGAVLNELILLAKKAYRCGEDCRNLVATLESVEPLLTRVDQYVDLGNATWQAWLKDFHTLLVEAYGIVGDCVVKRWRLSFKYVKRLHLSSQIQDVHRRIVECLSLQGGLVTLDIVQGIEHKLDFLDAPFPVIHQRPPFEKEHFPSHIVAFDNNPFKKVKESILSVSSSATKTIGIKGRGGGGKTLLAKMLSNDEEIKEKYGVGSILWLTIGQDVLISSLYRRMGMFLDNGGVFERDINGRDLESQRTYLMEAFKQKKALVILDDLRGNCEKNGAMIYWLDIFKGDGSTTLITMRDTEVIDHADAMEWIEVQPLSQEESWTLFSLHAFQPSIPPSCEVEDIAMEICNECKGLPLALEVIGDALWDKKDVRDWKYALDRLKRSRTNSATMEDELFRRLKYSYDSLDDEAKKCFLYFAAFPKDHLVLTEQLYSIWHVEGLFDSSNIEDTMEIGRMHLTTLADRSLIDLDDDGEHAKGYGVMQDLAMRIIQDAQIGEWAYECRVKPGTAFHTCTQTNRATCVSRAPIVQVIEPEEYLKFTKTCLERAQSLTGSLSLRFNYRQCKYLADKLKVALKSANSFLELVRKKCVWFPSQEDRAKCLKLFKLLYASANEVEDFIQSHCGKGSWIQAAISLTNVSEYVSAIGFDLELWRLVFSQSENQTLSLTSPHFDAIFEAEVGKVKEKASLDRKNLLQNVNAVTKDSEEFQLAVLLLERLEEATGSCRVHDFSKKSSISPDTVHRNIWRPEEAVFSKLTILNQLGKGSAATVYKATWLEGEYALKSFEGPDNNDFNMEISVLRGLSHPNIVSLLCSTTNYHDKCVIVVELMDGDLQSLMRDRILKAGRPQNNDNPESPFDIIEAVDLMLQVGRGMQYLHERRIVHRDLKAMNILVRRVKRDNNTVYVVAKVADFGLSKTKESTKTYSNQTLNLGTPRWMAPEMIKSRAGGSEQATMSGSKDNALKYPFKSDIYSFGMVCLEILTGDVPFSNVSSNPEVKNLVLKGGRPSLSEIKECPPLLKCLIERCWSKDPEKRPGFGEICAELRHLKCLLVMPSALGEVKPALPANRPEQAATTSNSSVVTGV